MRLPNSEKAEVAPDKVSLYLLNLGHPKGAAKARFLHRFGFHSSRPGELARALHHHAMETDVESYESDQFGTRYRLRGPLATPDGRNPSVLTVWVILHADAIPRFVTLVPERE